MSIERITKRAKEPQPAVCRRLVASRNLCSRFLPHAIQRRVQGVRAFAESLAFFLRHVRLEHFDHAAAADDARQGQRDAKLLLIAADRNDRALVIEHHLGDTGRYDADSVLASIMALDDGDVRIAHLSLQLMLQLANPLAAPLEQCRHWNSADPCRGPQEHLRGPVVANHLCFDMRGIRAEVLAEVNAKSLAVEICTCAQHHRPGARLARDIGERIGWIGHDEKYRVGLRPHDPWHDIAIDFGVLVEQFEAALWVVAIRSAAGFFVHARSDQHDARALEGVIITVDDVDLGTERCAVAHVGRYRLGGLAGAIDEDDLARAAAGDGGHCARAANIAGSNNSNSHRLLHCWLVNPAVIGAFRTGWPARRWLYPKNRRLAVKFRLYLANVRPSCRANEPLTPLQRGSLRTGTRCAARLRRSSSRSSWRWPRRRACRKSRGPRASSPPAACCRRAAPRACRGG